jgi:hypothetical protein
MTDNSKAIVFQHLRVNENPVYHITKLDLQETDRRIAEKLAKNEEVRQKCMIAAKTTFLK